MMQSRRCQVFIGSSSEGKRVARALQSELLPDCEVFLWDQGVFEPGGYTLDSLIDVAHRVDFAILVATPDDTRESRGLTAAIPRDNVILEFGRFAGALGRERTYVLATDGTVLPTDTLGLTRLAFHNQENLRAAVSEAAEQVRTRLLADGPKQRSDVPNGRDGDLSSLEEELKQLQDNAVAQGWTTRNTKTTFRLVSPRGRAYALPKSTPQRTREALRPFAARLRAGGLRVNTALRRPPSESPFS